MKTKHLLLIPVMLMLIALTVVAQNATDKKFSVQNIPFGKKLPSPDNTIYPDKFLPPINQQGTNILLPGMNIPQPNTTKKSPEYFKQLFLERKKMQAPLSVANKTPDATMEKINSGSSNFYLTKDINALAESFPRNFTNHTIDLYDTQHNDSVSYAVLNDVIYFVADDGIHGSELWRSDGTDAGTYMLKDIGPFGPYNVTEVNGKIYFASAEGAWVSDGTESGTQLLNPNVYDPGVFFSINNKTYFIADGLGYNSAIWETDGTAAGTIQVIDIGGRASGGEQIRQPTLVNGVLFFTFLDYETLGWQVWRSDLTDAGTYHVGPSYPVI